MPRSASKTRQRAPAVAPEPAASPATPETPTGLRHASDVVGLQQQAGNQAVAGLFERVAHPVVARSAAMAPQVRDQVAAGRFLEAEQHLAPGEYGPPAPGGAFWILNGLNPTDLLDTLRACGAPVREQLLAHVAGTAGRYDTPRLTAALRAQAAGEHAPGVHGIELLDAIRSAAAGGAGTSFAPVWAQLSGKARPELIGILRVLPRDARATLQAHISDAPAAEQQTLTEVLADLLGSGTDMAADDVIDIQPLHGLDQTMASIYNQRGRLLFEQATALGINTAAAAGIMKVESGGETFSAATDRSLMRFENHVFWRRWGHAHAADFNAHFRFNQGAGQHPWQGHRYRDDPADPWSEFHNNQPRERHVIALAVGLAGDVAYECASWGAGQVMGFNHAMVGFATARAMAEHYDRSEREQVTGIFEFIRATGLADEIRADDYEAVARGYNGAGQAAAYGARMRTAAEAYARVTAGKANVIP